MVTIPLELNMLIMIIKIMNIMIIVIIVNMIITMMVIKETMMSFEVVLMGGSAGALGTEAN